MAKKSIHTHVPTDLGVAILSIVVLLGVTFLLITSNTPQNTTSTQSHAAALPTPTKCQYYLHGACYNVYSHRCAKRYVQGYCPGNAYVQCCPR